MSSSPPITERLLEELECYLDEAHKAYTRRNLASAEDYAMLAADRLRQLAEQGPAELIESRAQAMDQIVDFVEMVRSDATAEDGRSDTAHEKSHGSAADSAAAEHPRFEVQEKPDLKLDDVAGMNSLKELIRGKLIYPLCDPDMTALYGVKSGGGILLYGPPGTGKSMIARAIAGEFDAAFISVKSSDLLDSLYGQTEKNIAALFKQAREYTSAVIFIDEIDAVGGNRDSSDSHMRRFVNQLLQEMQGFTDGLETALLLCATNKPWLLDTALIRSGRIDEMFYVALPDDATRREIWELSLHNKITDDSIDIDVLTARSAGLSGADIAGICENVNCAAFRKAVERGEEVPTTQASLLSRFPQNPERRHASDLEKLGEFARLHDRNSDVIPEISANGMRPSPLCWNSPTDLETFWRALLSALPTEGDLTAELAKNCAGLNFEEMCRLLAVAVEARLDLEAKTVQPLRAMDFVRAPIHEASTPTAPLAPQSSAPLLSLIATAGLSPDQIEALRILQQHQADLPD
jgi:SpoVK/Ycf46/Vps4 family AAA+-type ATPase